MFGTRFQIVRIWQRYFIEQILALSVLMGLFTIILVCSGFIFSGYKKVQTWTHASEASLILPGTIDADTLKKVEKRLSQFTDFESFRFQDKETYFKYFTKKYNQEHSAMSIRANAELFPNRYIVQISRNVSKEFTKRMSQLESDLMRLTKKPIRLIYGGRWISKSEKLVGQLIILGLALVILLCLLSAYISTVFSQNFVSSFLDELKIKALIGAKARHTIGPIYLNTILIGMTSYLLSVLISVILVNLSATRLGNMNLALFEPLSFFDFGFIALGIFSILSVIMGVSFLISAKKIKVSLDLY